jgi:hypothetical protein
MPYGADPISHARRIAHVNSGRRPMRGRSSAGYSSAYTVPGHMQLEWAAQEEGVGCPGRRKVKR